MMPSDKRWKVQGHRVIGTRLDGSTVEVREIPVSGPIPDLTPEQQRLAACELAEALNIAGRTDLSEPQRAVHDVFWNEIRDNGLCDLSEKQIAERLGRARATVGGAVDELISRGLLVHSTPGPRLIRRLRLPEQRVQDAGSAVLELVTWLMLAMLAGAALGPKWPLLTALAMTAMTGALYRFSFTRRQ